MDQGQRDVALRATEVPMLEPEIVHRHGGIGLLTPHDVHYGLADERLTARARVLTAAHAAHPERFPAGVPTPPPPPTAVWINPPTLAPIDAEETH
jgi:putative transposase